MDEIKVNLPEIKDSTNKVDLERYNKLKNLKKHPLDELEGSWNPINIYKKITYSFTKDLFTHGTKYLISEEVYPPLRQCLKTEENLPYVEKMLLEKDPKTGKRKRLLFQFLKLYKSAFIFKCLLTFINPFMYNFSTYLKADFIQAVADAIKESNNRSIDTFGDESGAYISTDTRMILVKKIVFYLLWTIFQSVFDYSTYSFSEGNKSGLRAGINGLIFRKTMKMQFVQSSKVKKMTQEEKDEMVLKKK